MNCREFIDFVMSYLDEELPQEQVLSFEEHLSLCSECRDYLDSYKTVLALEQELCHDLEQDVPPEVPEDLVTAILAARPA